MPSDEYATVVHGALKIKGVAPSGVKKHKKKRDKNKKPKSEGEVEAIEKAVVEGEEGMKELETKSADGKTAAERAYEEVRRRRVCLFYLFISLLSIPRFTSRYSDRLLYSYKRRCRGRA